jgi:hypothetical protein
MKLQILHSTFLQNFIYLAYFQTDDKFLTFFQENSRISQIANLSVQLSVSTSKDVLAKLVSFKSNIDLDYILAF